jgi:SAM-dependent methyltransferase
MNTTKPHPTSWQPVNKWYKSLIRNEGSYFHEHVVLPGALRLLNLKSGDRLLDLGCGEGILARKIPQNIDYLGIDIAPGLISAAKKLDKNPRHKYIVGDVTKNITNLCHSRESGNPDPRFHEDDVRISKDSSTSLGMTSGFSHACFILSLQNIDNPQIAMKNVSQFLTLNSKLLIVLNHPCFRIPRQTSWGIDEQNKIQYRRVKRYLSPLKIPINMHPGNQQSRVTWSYHNPISKYSEFMANSGFVIEKIEEWISDKVSVGSAASMENLSRQEFPLFMAIVGRKK